MTFFSEGLLKLCGLAAQDYSQQRPSQELVAKDLHGTEPDRLYEMLLLVVEKPLLEVVMQQAEQNQSRAAEWLGLNRNTLRKKLVEHKLIK